MKPTRIYCLLDTSNLSEEFADILCDALSKLPNKIVNWVTKNEKIHFISSNKKKSAFSLLRGDGDYEGFIFFCENLKNETKEYQTFTIAHEIAHQKLKHKSVSGMKYDNQELEANRKAMEWLDLSEIPKSKFHRID